MTSSALPRHRSPAGPDRRHLPEPPRRPASSGTPARPSTGIGRYRCEEPRGAWWWSPEMFALHGLSPGAAEPCAELLLAHQHPDDRGRVLDALTAAAAGRSFSLETRVLRPDGALRCVVLVGERIAADGAAAVEGMCVDITGTRPPGTDQELVATLQTEVAQLRAAMASRATIEQAKGILMLLTGCGDQVAFELLAHMSSHTHRKVREVAQTITGSATGRTRLPADLSAILRDACPPGHREG